MKEEKETNKEKKVKSPAKKETKTIKKDETKKVSSKKTTSKKAETIKEKENNEEMKAYKILSYIGVLWIIGLVVPQKNDKKLKFHVGQGIVLSIAELILMFLIRFFEAGFFSSIFRQEIFYNNQPTGLYILSFFGSIVITVLQMFLLFVIIYYGYVGIKNVLEDKQKELPIIGKFSFYK